MKKEKLTLLLARNVVFSGNVFGSDSHRSKTILGIRILRQLSCESTFFSHIKAIITMIKKEIVQRG